LLGRLINEFTPKLPTEKEKENIVKGLKELYDKTAGKAINWLSKLSDAAAKKILKPGPELKFDPSVLTKSYAAGENAYYIDFKLTHGKKEPSKELMILFEAAANAKTTEQVKWLEEQMKLYKPGGIIPQYQEGTSFVPSNQLAYLHKGEAVVPAEFNMGGLVGLPKFALGGDLSPGEVLKSTVKSAGEEIGKEIAAAFTKEVKGTSIDLNIPRPEDLPALSVTVGPDVEAALRSVGADNTTKMDQFIEAANSRIEAANERLASLEEGARSTIEQLNTLPDLTEGVNHLEEQLAFTSRALDTRLAAERSYIDSRVGEALSDFKTTEVNPIKNDLTLTNLRLNDQSNRIENDRDFVLANINRIDLAGSL
jgi:hypothetical protein